MVVQIVVLEAFSNGGKTFVDFLVKFIFWRFSNISVSLNFPLLLPQHQMIVVLLINSICFFKICNLLYILASICLASDLCVQYLAAKQKLKQSSQLLGFRGFNLMGQCVLRETWDDVQVNGLIFLQQFALLWKKSSSASELASYEVWHCSRYFKHFVLTIFAGILCSV